MFYFLSYISFFPIIFYHLTVHLQLFTMKYTFSIIFNFASGIKSLGLIHFLIVFILRGVPVHLHFNFNIYIFKKYFNTTLNDRWRQNFTSFTSCANPELYFRRYKGHMYFPGGGGVWGIYFGKFTLIVNFFKGCV